MLMTNFLKNRRSVREFRWKKVNNEILNEINMLLIELGNGKTKDKVKFNLYEDGKDIYEKLDGIGGYAGVMIESPHYIGLEELDNDKSTAIYGAYYMEKLITDLNRLGLDTCWVGVGDLDREAKADIFGHLQGQINYVLAFGHSKLKNPFVNEAFSERLGVEEIVYSGGIGKQVDFEELEHRGLDDLFYYVRFAPSKANLQPWRFLLDKDKVTLFLKHNKDEQANYMDAGIIMYYFEVLGKSAGINGEWGLVDGTHEDKDQLYEYIGEMQL